MTEITVIEPNDLAATNPAGAVDPYERARERVHRLSRSFAEVLTIVGEMERDEDWKYLTRADGTPYKMLREVIEDAMNVGAAMARRYIQGARGLYLPLSGVVVEGTTIQVTAADIADLGDEGMAEVVEEATNLLAGVEDPEEAGRIVAETVTETRERRSQPDDESVDDEWGDDGQEGPATFGGAGAYGAERDGSYTTGGDGEWPDEEWGDDVSPVNPTLPAKVDLVDPFAKVMDGARTYLTPDDQEDLEEPLRSIAAAIAVLARVEDPEAIARLINYDTRGVITPVDEALRNAGRIRVHVETSAWFQARQGL